MKICNVIEIYDGGEFVTIVTTSGTVIHLPARTEHSITILDVEDPSGDYVINVLVNLYK